MDPTRPLDTSNPLPDPGGAAAIRQVRGARPVVGNSEQPPQKEAVVAAESLGDTRRSLEVARSQVGELDGRIVDEVRLQVESGSYTVDAQAVADGIISAAEAYGQV